VVIAHADVSGARGHAPAILHLLRPAAPRERPAISLGRHAPACGCDTGVLACLRTIARTPWCDHKVIVFGGDDAGRRAASLGLRADARIAPPMGRVELGAPALRRWLKAHGEPRVVQCWGGEFGGLRSRIAGVSRLSRGAAWCVADMDVGVLESRSGHWPPATSALTAWLGPAAGAGGQRPRRAGPPRVVLLGDPPAAADSLALAYALGILNVGGVPATAVVARDAARMDRTVRHMRAGGYLRGLEVIDGSPLAGLRGFDLGVCVPMEGDPGVGEPSFAGKLAVRAALDAGLPVIVQDSPWAREVIPAGAHACIARSLESSDLARAACKLLTQGGLETASAELVAARPRNGRDVVKDVVDAWGLSPGGASERAEPISELKPAGAPAGSA
jgi:hypothetical protein